jgi:hypothetical protein
MGCPSTGRLDDNLEFAPRRNEAASSWGVYERPLIPIRVQTAVRIMVREGETPAEPRRRVKPFFVVPVIGNAPSPIPGKGGHTGKLSCAGDIAQAAENDAAGRTTHPCESSRLIHRSSLVGCCQPVKVAASTCRLSSWLPSSRGPSWPPFSELYKKPSFSLLSLRNSLKHVVSTLYHNTISCVKPLLTKKWNKALFRKDDNFSKSSTRHPSPVKNMKRAVSERDQY